MKVVIVGGVAGGASAAARLRRLDENAEIIIFEKSGFISYANCGLPYFIGGTITNKESLTLQTPESFLRRFNINARVHHEVTAINTENKTVTVKNLKTNESFDESYDKVILSPGAKTFIPNFYNAESDRVFTLRTVEDAFKINNFIDEKKPKTAIILGGGYIGIEMTENLIKKGIKVTIIENQKQILNVFDSDMASFVHAKLRSKGVALKLNSNVIGLKTENDEVVLDIENSESLKADIVILSIGVVPDSTLAKLANLSLGLRESIAVNERMQTSNKDIYAVGDAVEIINRVTNNQSLISLAGPANKQGRIAADNICGIDSTFKGSIGSSVIKIFDMTAACTGINEKVAKNLKIDYDKVVLSPSSHASYYPDGKVMTIKVLFEKTSLKILGAQIVGFDGVDKRIDVLATAIYSNLKADELQNLDLAYAPPYSSAKDPVNLAGFIIDNIVDNRLKQFHWDDLENLPHDNSVTLLDTRTTVEYAMGHAEGFINIPVDELRKNLDKLDKNKPVYIMCQSGLRSYIASCILNNLGYDTYNFSGGYRFYSAVMSEKDIAEKAFPCGMEK